MRTQNISRHCSRQEKWRSDAMKALKASCPSSAKARTKLGLRNDENCMKMQHTKLMCLATRKLYCITMQKELLVSFSRPFCPIDPCSLICYSLALAYFSRIRSDECLFSTLVRSLCPFLALLFWVCRSMYGVPEFVNLYLHYYRGSIQKPNL